MTESQKGVYQMITDRHLGRMGEKLQVDEGGKIMVYSLPNKEAGNVFHEWRKAANHPCTFVTLKVCRQRVGTWQ